LASTASTSKDEWGEEKNRAFGFIPPLRPRRCRQQLAQVIAARQFEGALPENTSLRPLPNVEGGPGNFIQHVFEPQLIGRVEHASSIQPGGRQFRDVPVFGNRHADYGPLRDRGVMLVPLQHSGILPDL
jgi:hypothetical protein